MNTLNAGGNKPERDLILFHPFHYYSFPLLRLVSFPLVNMLKHLV